MESIIKSLAVQESTDEILLGLDYPNKLILLKWNLIFLRIK
jgi:hypothetical protein